MGQTESKAQSGERGFFVTFEGIDGCGKSTQLRRLADRLARMGVGLTLTRDPGGTRIGDKVRGILLDTESEGMDARAEMALYFASRAQLVREVIEPALGAGKVVLCDRFLDSNIAYQAYGRGIPVGEVTSANAAIVGGPNPDLTFLIDVDPDKVGGRKRAKDRMEREPAGFHRRVCEGFRELARAWPERIKAIDGGRDEEAVSADVAQAFHEAWDRAKGEAAPLARTCEGGHP
ncbi:MAG: dTMP kinase [Oscillospiraceae bacterium]|nr:dTMP kinase [Oscillospiraceae bacterium]